MESSSRTVVCSVLFLDIVEYSKKAVADQLRLKQGLNDTLSKALAEVAPRDRIILDTGDGAAVTFVGDPEDALFAAMAMRDTAGPIAMRLGVNLGPVRVVKDLNGQVNIIGDGINVAQRVMSFAEPGQLLVSRSFYEVVSCLSRDYLDLFQHVGSRTDKHVREHEVYSVGGTPAARRVAETASRIKARERHADRLAATGPFGLRHTALVAAPLLFLVIVAGGVGARALMERESLPADAQTAPKIVAAASPSKPAAAAESVANQSPSPAKKLAAQSEKKPERKAAARAVLAQLEVAVTPWGEVLVDGKSHGVSPPLRVLEVSPGSHTIEVRNSTFPIHVEHINVKPGEAVRIRHKFNK